MIRCRRQLADQQCDSSTSKTITSTALKFRGRSVDGDEKPHVSNCLTFEASHNPSNFIFARFSLCAFSFLF